MGEAGTGGPWDVVVVGAGTAGCPLAARLADAGRRVLLLEAGRDHPAPEDFPPDLRDPSRMAAAVAGSSSAWHLTAELTDRRSVPVHRGRVVGGSSALNAAVFLRGRPADFDGWAADLGGAWTWAAVLPVFRRLEADLDLGAGPLHGDRGPMPVRRYPATSPVAAAFVAAAGELGFPAEPDKNAGGPEGVGPVPLAVRDGVRVNTAMAYLSPRRGAAALTVRGGVEVTRVLVERGRAVGVQTSAGPIRAAEVVLSAGAVGSPQLLLRSGIGPADELRAAGLDVVADVPGVGRGATDHPQVHVAWRPAAPVPDGDLPLTHALHVPPSSGGGGLELLPWLTPFARVVEPGAGEDRTVSVGLQREESRGRLTLRAGDPAGAPRLRYGYLAAAADRDRLRDGVRLAADLLRAPAFAALGATRTDLPDAVLADDAALDGWIRERLVSAVHLSGTARMGGDGDPGAVVDPELRVRGLDGLRIADTSVLPTTPSRGPAATAVLLGERAADLITGARPGGPGVS